MKNTAFVIWMVGYMALVIWERNSWRQRYAEMPQPLALLGDLAVNAAIWAFVGWLLYER